jgi:glycosyltransferase involved in cell wall biosynthesis
VACSQWLASETQKSALLTGQDILSIPNPIDNRLYAPSDKCKARQQLGLPENDRLILFVSQRVTNPNKGMFYLMEACQQLVRQYPEMEQHTSVVVLGGHAEDLHFPFQTYPLGYVNDEQRIVQVYRAVDVFVLPSLSENLPNSIMEAMACGVPCIGFRIGGIPEMIEHLKNGYLATYRDAADLAKGLHYVLAEADYDDLSRECLKKVAHNYSQQSVAKRYQEVYNKVMNSHKQYDD